LDIGNIADPNLIASAGLSQLRKPIWSYRFIVEAISRLRPITSLLTTAEPELAPDPIDSLSAVVASTVTKLRLQPRRTVSTPTLLVNFTDLLGQPPIFLGSRTRVSPPLDPLIKTAAAYAQGFAEHLDRVNILHFFDPLVPFEGP